VDHAQEVVLHVEDVNKLEQMGGKEKENSIVDEMGMSFYLSWLILQMKRVVRREVNLETVKMMTRVTVTVILVRAIATAIVIATRIFDRLRWESVIAISDTLFADLPRLIFPYPL
jgi:hypothetical protein